MSSLLARAKAQPLYRAPVVLARASGAKTADRGGKYRGGKCGTRVAIALKRPRPSCGAAIEGVRR
jgi:hypothetical protein